MKDIDSTTSLCYTTIVFKEGLKMYLSDTGFIPRKLMECWGERFEIPMIHGGAPYQRFKEFCASDEQLRNLDINEDNWYDIQQSLPREKSEKWASFGLETHKFILGTITEKEAKILTMRFNLDGNGFQTLASIGKYFGVTGERIRTIEENALRKLRQPSRRLLLNIFDDEMLNCTLENYSQFTSEKMEEILVSENRLVNTLTEEELKLYDFILNHVLIKLFELDAGEYFSGRDILSNEELFKQCKELKQLGLVPFTRYDNHKDWFNFIKYNVKDIHNYALQILKNTNSIYSGDMPIENLELSVRAYNCLKRAGIDTVGDLLLMTKEDLIKIRNLGKKPFEEILQRLDSMGLSLSPNDSVKKQKLLNFKTSAIIPIEFKPLGQFLTQAEIDEINQKFKKEETIIKANPEMWIEELDLSVRSFNCLKRAGIDTVEKLIKMTEEELFKVRNLGKKSAYEVLDKIKSLGLTMRLEEDMEVNETIDKVTTKTIANKDNQPKKLNINNIPEEYRKTYVIGAGVVAEKEMSNGLISRVIKANSSSINNTKSPLPKAKYTFEQVGEMTDKQVLKAIDEDISVIDCLEESFIIKYRKELIKTILTNSTLDVDKRLELVELINNTQNNRF